MMATGAHFLAFDLGAESGRAMLGRLRLVSSTSARSTASSTSWSGRTDPSSGMCSGRLELKQGMERAAGTPIESVGVDAWGCDYALVGEQGVLLQNPYHYRDKRTDGIMEAVFERVPADEIYAVTGIQFLPFNTLYQLYAAPLDAAAHRRGDVVRDDS